MARRKSKRGLKRRVNSETRPLRVTREATRLLLRGKHERALKILHAAITEHPDNAALQTRAADALYCAERVAEARDAYRRALAMDDSEFQAWYGCGMAEFSLGAYANAIECFRSASRLAPADLEVQSWLGKSLFEMGEVDAAIDAFQRASRSKNPAFRESALRSIAIIIPGRPKCGNAEILKARRRWAELAEKRGRIRITALPRALGRRGKVRVGYVSSFFHHRNWMKPVWGVINCHDRSAFEIHLFADRGLPSAESGYECNPCDFVHDITNLSNGDAAKRIAAAELDVLADLNGYSDPDRLGIFMRKPARVVLGWFGMYATTGIRAFQWVVGDANVIQPEEEQFCSERVLRVSGSYMAFRVLYPVPPVVTPPCLKTGQITFGCLAPQYKITDEMIATWSRILVGAPGARVLMKNQSLADSGNLSAVQRQFARHGIFADRLVLEMPAEHYGFLRAYDRVDITLDTFPYNGGTTTAESLWQGVPVLAVNGDRWVSRISKSILKAAGMGQWVEESVEGYVRRGIELANSAETAARLAEMRAEMRGRLLESAACDTAALCRELEQHYRNITSIGKERDRQR